MEIPTAPTTTLMVEWESRKFHEIFKSFKNFMDLQIGNITQLVPTLRVNRGIQQIVKFRKILQNLLIFLDFCSNHSAS